MSVLLHHPTPAHAAPQIFEPSEAFKAQLRRRIDDNLDQLLLDAKRSYDDKLLALSSATPRRRPAPQQRQQQQQQNQPPLSPSPLDAADEDRGANDLLYRRKLYFDYLQSVQELKAFARDEYNHAIERERQEMEWCLEAEASVAQAHQDQGLRMVALEEGRYDDEEEQQQQRGRMQEEERFRVDETLKEEQFEMLEAFHEEMKRAEAKARAIEHPSSDDEDGYYHASDDSSEEEEEYENVAPVAGPSGYYRRETLVELSEIEEESEQEEDDEEYSEPGTPIVQPLDAQLKAHAEELSRLLSATPSPPPSPCLTGSSLPASPFSLLSQAHLADGPSPISSPSPPDTPPSLSASASASDYEQDTDTAPSSVASSIIFDPKAQDGVVAISSASGNGMIFTPQRSVIDEEIRVRQERHFKQQEEFHRKAEEIRRKKVEDKKMSRMNEMLVSLVKDSGAKEKEKTKAATATGSSTPPIGNQALVVAGKAKTVTPFNSPRTTTTVARRAAVPTPAPRYASAPTTPSKYRTATPSQALAVNPPPVSRVHSSTLQDSPSPLKTCSGSLSYTTNNGLVSLPPLLPLP
ncbi:hypothetical protein BKA70DRAFT_69143 [Coprinopsis sp. MPI-PUGE-AT-0042]|nr:hypothetical protein BKA70DRAFT_69143 [Coprinopsis sp. MPI-PUGE-AT-0042]